MARYTESVCRLCRRENLKLFLKGERCYTDKCAIERRNYPPGQHGQKRPKFSEYSIQLREKQKLKRLYGLPLRGTGRHPCRGLAHRLKLGRGDPRRKAPMFMRT